MTFAQERVISPVVWMCAPDWLTVEEACDLSGWNRASMLEIIDEGGVDLDNDGLIEKRSLSEFLEALALVVHWNDWLWSSFRPYSQAATCAK